MGTQPAAPLFRPLWVPLALHCTARRRNWHALDGIVGGRAKVRVRLLVMVMVMVSVRIVVMNLFVLLQAFPLSSEV